MLEKGFLQAVFASVLAVPWNLVSAMDAEAKTIVTQSGEAVDLPVCFDSQGGQVRFQEIRLYNPMEPTNHMAESFYAPMSGGPIIRLHPIIKTLPPEVIEYTARHECAHHELGHAREVYRRNILGENFSQSTLYHYELSADCSAAVRLQGDKGYIGADFKRIFSYIPDQPHSKSHPRNSMRLDNIDACLSTPAMIQP